MQQEPTVAEAEAAIRNVYARRNKAVGGGGWRLDTVRITAIYPDLNGKGYIVEARIQGIHSSPPIAHRRADEVIDETRMLRIEQQGNAWICVDE